MHALVAAALLRRRLRCVLVGGAALVAVFVGSAALGQTDAASVGHDAFAWLRLAMYLSVALGVAAGSVAFVWMRNSFMPYALLGGICIAMLVAVVPFSTARSLLLTAEAEKCADSLLKAELKPYDRNCMSARELTADALLLGWGYRKFSSIGPAMPLSAESTRWLGYLSVLIWPALLLPLLRPWLEKRFVPL